jgi:hypothetical protein
METRAVNNYAGGVGTLPASAGGVMSSNPPTSGNTDAGTLARLPAVPFGIFSQQSSL